MHDDKFERLHEADGVFADWVTSPHYPGSGYAIVMDEGYTVRIAISASYDGKVSATFAEKLGDRFGIRNNDEVSLNFGRSEISITDEGHLVAMEPMRYKPGLPFRQGFIVDLPPAFVPAVRIALAKAFDAAEAALRAAAAAGSE